MIFTFDPPETGWGLNAQAIIVANPSAPSQPNSLHLIYGTGFDAVASRTLTGLTVGEKYAVYVRCNFDGDGGGGAALRLSYNNVTIGTMNKGSETGWELRYVGVLDYNFADRTLRVIGIDVPALLATVEVDTLYIGGFPPMEVAVMARKWAAIDAALDVIRTMTGVGAGFNTDLEQRAYSRLFTPAEQPDVKLPYVCVPLDQEAERIEYEGLSFTSTWHLVGHAFFADDQESDPLNSGGSVSAARFRDDLIRAFMVDQHLGGLALDCSVTSVDTASGVIDDGIAEVIFTVEFTQMAGANDLQVA